MMIRMTTTVSAQRAAGGAAGRSLVAPRAAAGVVTGGQNPTYRRKTYKRRRVKPSSQAFRKLVDAISVETSQSQQDLDEACDATWVEPLGVTDIEELMAALPEGLQFSNARPHGEVSATTDAYNREMCERMGSDICYYHEWGMNYTHILPNIIVGSVPQDARDVEYLAQHLGVTAILNLQEEKDWQKFSIDFGRIQDRCNELGTIKLVRCPIVDFDANSLRKSLPGTVTRLDDLIKQGHTVYIHCTAGLGRAPGVAITYLHWIFDMSLEEAYSYFTSRRNCNPRAAAIRGATLDMQMGTGPVSFSWDSSIMGNASHVEVAGSFNDWAAPGLQMRKYADGFFMRELCLGPGLHQYKLIADGQWTTDPHLPSCTLDGNQNNVLLVKPTSVSSVASTDSVDFGPF